MVEDGKTYAKVVENRDEAVIKVEGQATEFGNETSQEESGTDSETDEEGELVENRNFNHRKNTSKTFDGEPVQPGMSRITAILDEFEEEVRILPRDEDKVRKEEEKDMQRFIYYMHKQGLIIVEASKVNSPPAKFKKNER